MISKHHRIYNRIVNWIIITAKVAIWNTRVNKIKEDRLTDALSFFRGRIKGRLTIEYKYNLNSSIDVFKLSGYLVLSSLLKMKEYA